AGFRIVATEILGTRGQEVAAGREGHRSVIDLRLDPLKGELGRDIDGLHLYTDDVRGFAVDPDLTDVWSHDHLRAGSDSPVGVIAGHRKVVNTRVETAQRRIAFELEQCRRILGEQGAQSGGELSGGTRAGQIHHRSAGWLAIQLYVPIRLMA